LGSFHDGFQKLIFQSVAGSELTSCFGFSKYLLLFQRTLSPEEQKLYTDMLNKLETAYSNLTVSILETRLVDSLIPFIADGVFL
jgi:hypothetical protein